MSSAPALRITFLGTGTSSGVPMVACQCEVCTSPDSRDKRLRSSILVQSDTTTVLVDATPDFRQQMLQHAVRRLDGILITHPHKDHVGGLDDTRGFQYFQQAPTQVYGSSLSLQGVVRELPYAFEKDKYPGTPMIELNEIGADTFYIGNIPIQPILVWHHRMPVQGFRFNNFTYITDANRIDASEMEKIKGSETMVLNALRKEKHLSHYSLAEAVQVVQQCEVPKAWFTHISHQLGTHEAINAQLPNGFELAYDGLQIQA